MISSHDLLISTSCIVSGDCKAKIILIKQESYIWPWFFCSCMKVGMQLYMIYIMISKTQYRGWLSKCNAGLKGYAVTHSTVHLTSSCKVRLTQTTGCRAEVWQGQCKCHVECLYPRSQWLVWVPAPLCIATSCCCAPWRHHMMAQGLRPSIHVRTWMEFQLLALAWFFVGCCGDLWSQVANGRSVSVFLFLPF